MRFFFGMTTSTVSDLLYRELGWVALEMNKMIASKTKEDAINFLKQWIKSPKMTKMNALASDHALATGSSPRFNMYINNFGWGSPLAVRSGARNKFDGKLTVSPKMEALILKLASRRRHYKLWRRTKSSWLVWLSELYFRENFYYCGSSILDDFLVFNYAHVLFVSFYS